MLAKIGQTKVAASAWSQGHLGGDYGITLPEELRISIDVKQAEGNWVPTVTDLDGRYSIQARILPHQADVPNAAVATALNYQAIIAALDTLGEPGGTHNHYSLKAVQTHESRHATRILQALENTRARIETDVAAAAIPEASAPDKGTAKTQIEASPAFLAIADNSAPLVATNAYNAWFHELLRLVQNDHDTHGPCRLPRSRSPSRSSRRSRSVRSHSGGWPRSRRSPFRWERCERARPSRSELAWRSAPSRRSPSRSAPSRRSGRRRADQLGHVVGTGLVPSGRCLPVR